MLTTPVPGFPVCCGTWYWGAPRTGHLHTGIDHATPSRLPLLAPADGRIQRVLTNRHDDCGYGLHLDIGGDRVVGFCHCDDLASIPAVGTEVERGDPIARAGRTGNATGIHLHWSLRVSGWRVDPYHHVAWPECRGAAWAQGRLARLGIDPGPIDGIAGRRTLAAVGAAQAGLVARERLGIVLNFCLDAPTVREIGRPASKSRIDFDRSAEYVAAAFPDVGRIVGA